MKIRRYRPKQIWRQIRRQSLMENLRSIWNLVRGSALSYFWKNRRFALARSRGEHFILANGRETYLLSTRDLAISPRLFAEGEFDFYKFERAIDVLGARRLTTLLDIGAHVGCISIPAVSRKFVDRAVAVEPDSENYGLLQSNILMNGLEKKIVSINAAVGPSRSSVFQRFDGGSNTGDHRFTLAEHLPAQEASANTPAIVLDSFSEAIEVETSLLWMDIQGGEGLALEGARNLLEAGIPVVLELDPTLLEPNGGLRRGFSLLEGYASFLDLGSPLLIHQDMSSLETFYSEALAAGTWHDLLFVPSGHFE